MITIRKPSIKTFIYRCLLIPYTILSFVEDIVQLITFDSVHLNMSFDYLVFLSKTKNLTSFRYYRLIFLFNLHEQLLLLSLFLACIIYVQIKTFDFVSVIAVSLYLLHCYYFLFKFTFPTLVKRNK